MMMMMMVKYIKSVLWRVAKRLSYIEDARTNVGVEVNGADSELFPLVYFGTDSFFLNLTTIVHHFPRLSYRIKVVHLVDGQNARRNGGGK